MATEGTKAVLAAMLANVGIAVAKFVVYLVTGSASMLAESIHSVADTSNQGLCCLVGGERKGLPTIGTSSDMAGNDSSGRSS
ncbi:MAG TPA: cation transporter [Acidimicrobiia bacterium]|nr:cation transporter [Acidimicrobiia bacterium]